MPERESKITHFPMSLFHGERIQRELNETNGLILPKGTKSLLLLSLPNDDVRNLGPMTLTRDFMGTATEGVIHETYHGLPQTAKRINLIPDSEERKEKMQQQGEIQQLLSSLFVGRHKRQGLYHRQKTRIDELIGQRTVIQEQIRTIDRGLRREFLDNIENDIALFNIDPNQVIQINLQIAVDKDIRIPRHLLR